MGSRLWGLAALLAALAGPASAEVYTWTYRGFVADGLDETGVLGAPGTDLTGLRWQARVRTDTGVPDAVIQDVGYGSEIMGAGTVTIAITIAGATYQFGVTGPDEFSGIDGDQVQVDGPFHALGFDFDQFEYFRHEAMSTSGVVIGGVTHYRNDQLALGGFGVGPDGEPGPDTDFLPGGDFRTLPALRPGPDRRLAGYLLFSSYVDDGVTQSDVRQAQADLTVTSVTPGVPEPSTWALMIAGFGAAGAALRRREGLRLRALSARDTPPLKTHP
jgi:hypothetical protein